MIIVNILFITAGLYLLAGFVFAILFSIRGVDKIDESAHGCSIGFRIIIIPGAMVFWPLLLSKWITATKPNKHD